MGFQNLLPVNAEITSPFEALDVLRTMIVPGYKRLWLPWEIRCTTPDINGQQTMYRYLISGTVVPSTDTVECHGCEAFTICAVIGRSHVPQTITPQVYFNIFSNLYDAGPYSYIQPHVLGAAQAQDTSQVVVFDTANAISGSGGAAALAMPLLWSVTFKAALTQAAITAALTATAVSSLTVGTVGVGYIYAPPVGFTGGGGPSGTPTMLEGSVASVAVSGGTTLWTAAPAVFFIGGGGSGAAGHCTITGGNLAVVVDSGGEGYTSAPTVAFQGGTTTNIGGAAAHVTVASGAVVSPGVVDAGGTGYTSVPTVVVGPPNAVFPVTLWVAGR